MRRPGAAHSVAWKHQKREIQLGSRQAYQRIGVLETAIKIHSGNSLANRVTNRVIFRQEDNAQPNDSKSIDMSWTVHGEKWLERVGDGPSSSSLVSDGDTEEWLFHNLQRSMKALTSQLSCVGRCSLPRCGPRDETNRWSVTLLDIAVERKQRHQNYRFYCAAITSSHTKQEEALHCEGTPELQRSKLHKKSDEKLIDKAGKSDSNRHIDVIGGDIESSTKLPTGRRDTSRSGGATNQSILFYYASREKLCRHSSLKVGWVLPDICVTGGYKPDFHGTNANLNN
ncbi:hypothetical protein CLF_100750 [Clonorchis sinensis]|uniref:Uncharacterized protein n=1 Tax=Clonorchis sinensis TaxID=79923 RepID=G7Y459_CLOSI|nr:hypothetical protein CLF_100750 [Clonorchis sinensis]